MRLLVVIAILTSVWCWPSLAAEPVETRILKAAHADYIVPAYQQFSQSTDAFTQQAGTFCNAPSQDAFDRTRQQFITVTLSWAHVEWFRVGPVLESNRLERILFFPDRKGTGRKQVQKALRTQDDRVTDQARLALRSVAVQGLGAIEYLLFGQGHELLIDRDGGQFRCAYLMAAARNLATISDDLLAGWREDQPIAQAWINPAAENPLFRDHKEAMNQLIGTLIHGLEAIRDIRLGSFLREPPPDRPKLAIYWRSQATFSSIQSGVEGLYALYEHSGLANVLDEETAYIDQALRFEFEQAIAAASALNRPVVELVDNPKDRQKIVYLKQVIGYLIERLDGEFAPAAGLAAGFSFGDGD